MGKNLRGKKMLDSVNTIHCQTIMNNMADEGYRTSTIYQTKIALYIIPMEWADIVFLCKKGTPVKNSTYIPCFLNVR